MSDLTSIKAYTLGTDEGLNSVNIIEESNFGHCALLSEGQELSFGSIAENGQNVADFTCSVWVKPLKEETVFRFSDIFSVSTDESRTLSLAGIAGDGQLALNEWQHLCWVKQGLYLRLYLNGSQVQSMTPATWGSVKTYQAGDTVVHDNVLYIAKWAVIAGDQPSVEGIQGSGNPWYTWHATNFNHAWADTQAVSYSCNKGQIHLAHQHFYSRSLTVAEIWSDRAENMPTASEAYPDTYPLDVNLINPRLDTWQSFSNNLMIVDTIDNIKQAVEIKNINHDTISLTPLASDVASSDNYHFELRFRNATFSNQTQYPDFSCAFDAGDVSSNMVFESSDDWNISALPVQNSEDWSWSIYFVRKSTASQMTVGCDEALVFPFQYATADGSLGERTSHLVFYYKNMQFSTGNNISGDRLKQINVFNFSSTNTVISQISQAATNAGEKVNAIENELTQKMEVLMSETNLIEGTVGNITDAVGLLVGHAKALDAELDIKTKYNEEKFETLEALYPLQISSHAPAGCIVGNTLTTLEISLYNRLSSPVTFFNGSVVVKLPLGSEAGDLCLDYDSAGNELISGISVSDQDESDNTQGKFNALERSSGTDCAVFQAKSPVSTVNVSEAPDNEKVIIGAGEHILIRLEGLAINAKEGVSFIEVEINGLVNQQNNDFSIPVIKTTRNLDSMMAGGNVGIGTDSPTEKLHVEGNVRAHGTVEASSLYFSGLTKDIVWKSGHRLQLGKATDASCTNFSLSMIIDIHDNVGIGVGAPSCKLDVDGDIKSRGRIKDEKGEVMPVGGIIMWSGSAVPEGWALCNGQDGHPDLQDRFIVGAGAKYATGAEGGVDEVTLTENQMPSHNHGGATEERNIEKNSKSNWKVMHPETYTNEVKSGSNSSIYDRSNEGTSTLAQCIDFNHDHPIKSAGKSEPHENRPPYYALAFIIKL